MLCSVKTCESVPSKNGKRNQDANKIAYLTYHRALRNNLWKNDSEGTGRGM